jgi:hypothetical protein
VLKRVVRATAFYPGVSQLYRLYYALAIRVTLLLARRIPEVRAVFTHRGFGSGDWVAGFSDIDLLVLIDPMEPAGEMLVLERFWRGVRALRVAFPFIGTIHLVTSAELACWQRHGGIRRREMDRLKQLYTRS